LVDDISAALIIRVWSEGGAEQFRARLTSTDTSLGATASGERTVALAVSRGDVIDAVGKWLDDFLRRASEPIDTE
jgi:hypothetical protein